MAPTLKWYPVYLTLEQMIKYVALFNCWMVHVLAMRYVISDVAINVVLCLQVLYSYSIGFIYILTGLLCLGGLGPAVAFCSEVSKPLDNYMRYHWHSI